MMRRSHRNGLILLFVLLAVAAVWAYQNQPLWLPQASQWMGQTWRGLTRPSEPARVESATTASRSGDKVEPAIVRKPRKCTASDGHVTYTDGACPAGTQEQWLDESKAAIVESVPAAPRQKAR